ncbi:hypothetical protein FHK92_23730 [Pseudomonas brassicacearum subsp. neoaurantiaca]|uniref:Uncharacterized protein n=1 Tax=Pseudomonas brassicacearum subsp. neoaurantiaca TaxID=494916 RepID=A0A7V8UFU6_9PSED|nr:hypothetical protein [Pseudomonas brassicacearum subsp. neoaurantiaca]
MGLGALHAIGIGPANRAVVGIVVARQVLRQEHRAVARRSCLDGGTYQ